MRIINEALLDTFRRKEACEYCKTRTQSGLDPHHYLAKGMGSGRRIDHPWNLLAVCRACHQLIHQGQIARCDLLAVIATREKTTQDAIELELHRLVRLPRAYASGCEKPLRKRSASKCGRKSKPCSRIACRPATQCVKRPKI